MKLLLDTHTFIWWDSDPLKLTPQVLNMCQDPENLLLLSVASVWEMQIKLQFGRLKLTLPLAELVAGQQQTNKIVILNVKLEHILALEKLPPHHKDPFDRLLIAQADIEEAVLVSKDQIFKEYPVQTVW
ncbi:MAG: type II toxin-antitoxin system VapC family toxin [Desulfobacterales bacterium]|nr:type II toxin-antitoxin system VapC family toxin [Desulfobacterales bacterium]